MSDLQAAAMWAMAMTQVLGLFSAFLVRVTEGSAFQSWSHRIFVGCLVVLGLLTVAGHELTQWWSLIGGSTLSIMLLFATCHLGRVAPLEQVDL